jgi:hypothetical protein
MIPVYCCECRSSAENRAKDFMMQFNSEIPPVSSNNLLEEIQAAASILTIIGTTSLQSHFKLLLAASFTLLSGLYCS